MAIRQSLAFGDLLRQHRVAAGLTQEALAERAGLSARGIADLERGVRRFPQPATLKRLASSLQLTPAELAELSAAGNRTRGDASPAMQRTALSLPVPPTSFVGREADLAEVRALLPTTRVMTLSGAGGVGKTRLALAVASEVAPEYRDGVWFVDLGPLGDGSLVPNSVASVLAIRERPGRPLLEVICEAVGDRILLLLLDNCEHVAMASAAVVEKLIQHCPGVRILATSREALRTAGETLWRVPSLRVPERGTPLTEDSLATYGAAQLFVERARAAVPAAAPNERQLRAIARICQQLDGVPLAIELAAARTRMFSVEQIAERLDRSIHLLSSGARTAPPRQQTLRATIDWSYGLLPEIDRLLLDRLSVFAGAFTFEAAEAVCCGEPIRSDDVIDLLGGLVDRSLVVAEPGPDGSVQYRLLKTLSQYGQERLAMRGQMDSTRQKHATYFLNLAEETEPNVLAADRKEWLDQLEAALDEFRAARQWFVRSGEAEGALRLAGALYRLCMYRGYADEGRRASAEALSLAGGSKSARAKALFCEGGLGVIQAEYDTSLLQIHESAALRREIGDEVGLAWSLMGAGAIATLRADFEVANELLREAREQSRTRGGQAPLALSLAWSADMAYARGNFAEARAFAREGVSVSETIGFATPACMSLSILGNLSWREGDRQAAERLLSAALAKAEALDEAYLIARAAIGLALLAVDDGDPLRARALLARSLRLAQQVGNRHHVALALEGLAALAAANSDAEIAMRLAGGAAVVREQIGAPRSPTEASMLEARLEAARQHGGARVSAVIADSEAWSVDQAICYATDVTQATSMPEAEPFTRTTDGLTPREREVARLVARGMRNSEVAAELVINIKTAKKNHVQRVLEKLGVNSRSQIIARAQEFGLE